jgi:2,4-dienoyl-CoA reductase-like NADH-dependent reductase (Old Yellow Enzyme family)
LLATQFRLITHLAHAGGHVLLSSLTHTAIDRRASEKNQVVSCPCSVLTLYFAVAHTNTPCIHQVGIEDIRDIIRDFTQALSA